MQVRASFILAHRLSIIRDADQVLVIDSGQIIERGTYHSLYVSQCKGYAT